MATTRKPRMKVTPPDDITDGAPSVMSLKSNPAAQKVQWRDVFEIDGTMHQIRAAVAPNDGLRYIHLFRTMGEAIANDYMLETLLSPGAYEALMTFKDLTRGDLAAVLKIAMPIMLGQVESPN